MKRLSIVSVTLLVASCAHNPSLIGKKFGSEPQLGAAIATRWPLRAVDRMCRPDSEQLKNPSQPPLVLADSNWRGEILLGPPPASYRLKWEAIVIRREVEVFIVRAFRGENMWILEWDGSPELLQYEPGKIPRLIKESEAPNKSARANAHHHSSSAYDSCI